MMNVIPSTQFKRDLRRCVKRGYDLNLLQAIIETLRIPKALPPKNKDHNLSGDYAGFRECHILPDWLLTYYVDGNTIYLDRTGTHSDLFGK